MQARVLIISVWVLALSSCTRTVIIEKNCPCSCEDPSFIRNDKSKARRLKPSARIAKILAVARAHLGKRSIKVNGRSFRYDCSGLARAAFSTVGLDLLALGHEYPKANGVRLVYNYVRRYVKNHTRKRPAVGDVVYFDNTWDRNKNGKIDDHLTHVGIVESVDPDGTVSFIHRASRGIVRDPMNLYKPHVRRDEKGKALNGWLRRKRRGDPKRTLYLNGELFAGFGTPPVKPPSINVSALERPNILAELETLRLDSHKEVTF